MREEEILACATGAWYERFRSITFKTEIIPLPEEFVRFLLTDGICLAPDQQQQQQDDRRYDSDSSLEDAPAGGPDGRRGGSGASSSGSSSAEEEEEASFPELEARVATAIRHLGGKVLPKLNWSAPKDTTWLYGSLRGSTPREIFTLLKASDFVSHDLCHSFDQCSSARTRPDEFTLVLRRWHTVHEAGEFRCFVADGSLLAISQRQTAGLFEHLAQQEEVEVLQNDIRGFFEQHLRGGFSLQRYAFDVYVGAAPQRRVRLVDFSPWGSTTDACLFDWPELVELAASAAVQEAPAAPEFRVVREEADRRGKAERYSQIPLELARLGAGEGEAVEDFLRKADQLLKQREGSQ